jgi:hypothetical protein
MARPSMMYRPRPPSATYAAIVAVEITCSTELRIPPMISGRAFGSSTPSSTSRPRIPIPRAASTTAGSTLRTPA